MKKVLDSFKAQKGKIDGAFFVHLFIGIIIISMLAKLMKYLIAS